MIYGSVCSGIEAATAACKKCLQHKTFDKFHKRGIGYQAWCKECHNEYQRLTRKRRETPQVKAAQNYKYRYGLTVEEVKEMVNSQNGKCALCDKNLIKYVVDHCHITNKVRGILCPRCNVIIGGLDDASFRLKAIKYLEFK